MYLKLLKYLNRIVNFNGAESIEYAYLKRKFINKTFYYWLLGQIKMDIFLYI